MLIRSEDALTEILDMDPAIAGDPLFADFISGNHVLDGSSPVAHRYGGYQFGYWVSIDDLQRKVLCFVFHGLYCCLTCMMSTLIHYVQFRLVS